MNKILYHKNCIDGFMSAVLMYLYFKEIGEIQQTEFVAVNYNEPMPDITDKHVYIVDFSYPKDVIVDAATRAKSITMLDHHLSAAQQWGGYIDESFKSGLPTHCQFNIKIAEHQSGAGLTYNWVMRNILYNAGNFNNTIFVNDDDDRILDVVKAVQDRDLWIFKRRNTKKIHEALSILPRTFEAWEEFLVKSPYDDFKEKIKAAGYYLEVKEKLAIEYASKHELVDFLGYRVPIVNCPANFASSVGEILYQGYPFSVTYCLDSKIIYCSLRSNSEDGIDVSELAVMFLGGGHKNSSGCKLPTELFQYLLHGQLEYIRRRINPSYNYEITPTK